MISNARCSSCDISIDSANLATLEKNLIRHQAKPNIKIISRAFSMLALASMLAACGGGSDSGSSGGTSGSGGSSSANGSSCIFKDLIDSTERAQANACGIQVSANYASADSMLQSAIAACQAGKKAEAQTYYDGTYTKQVAYARSASKALSCGTSSTPTLPAPTAQTYYNLCGATRAVSGGISRTGSCYGPVKLNDSTCGSSDGLSYLNQFTTQASCIAARETFINSR